MKSIKYFLILLILFSASVYSQEIYFCKSFTEDGEPIDADQTWGIKAWGSLVYILYNNGDEPIDDDIGYFFIDKYDGRNYQPFDSKVVRIETGKTWSVYNYKFTEPGKYEVYFMNSTQKRLATSTVNIILADEQSTRNRFFTSRYYDEVEFIFCQIVINGKPKNIRRSTSLSQDAGQIYIFLNSNDSLKTSILQMNVWRKTEDSMNFDEFIETKKYKVEPTWFDTFFRYIFKETGEYQVSIYNENEQLIKSNYITVTE